MDNWSDFFRYVLSSFYVLIYVYLMTRLITTAYFKSKEDHSKRLQED